MAVFRERVRGWLYRIGASKYGEPYTASIVVTDDGWAKGLAGTASPVILREALRQAENDLGLKLRWERYRNMAGRLKDTQLFDAEINMQYCNADDKSLKARAKIEYFGMDQKHIDTVEGVVLGGLLSLRKNQE